MIIAIYEYEIDPEDEKDYLKLTQEIIRPFWTDRGIKYSVFKSIEERSKFVKIMEFPSETFLNTALLDKDAETERVVSLFKHYAKNLKRTLYKQIL
ncbi:MAG: hypothetical protein ABIM02_00375 [candidate division WOR-3 bacterium]